MYEQFALQYHEKRSCEHTSLWNLYLDRPTIQALIASVPEGLKTLDLGCGSGLLTGWLKNKGYEVCGVDFSYKLLSIAREENPDISFATADIKLTPYKDAAFDLVVSGLVMHYEQDLAPAFAEVSRILNMGGLFVFTMHHPIDEVTNVKWNGSEYQAVMSPYFHNRQYKWTMLKGRMELISYHHTFDNISETLNRHGFVIERIRESQASDDLRERYPHFHARTNAYPSFCGFRARKV